MDAPAVGPDVTTAEVLGAAAHLPRRKTEAVLVHLERLGAIEMRGRQVIRRIAVRDAKEIAALRRQWGNQ